MTAGGSVGVAVMTARDILRPERGPVSVPDPAGCDVVLAAREVDLVRDGRDLLRGVSVTVRAGEQWAANLPRQQ